MVAGILAIKITTIVAEEEGVEEEEEVGTAIIITVASKHFQIILMTIRMVGAMETRST